MKSVVLQTIQFSQQMKFANASWKFNIHQKTFLFLHKTEVEKSKTEMILLINFITVLKICEILLRQQTVHPQKSNRLLNSRHRLLNRLSLLCVRFLKQQKVFQFQLKQSVSRQKISVQFLSNLNRYKKMIVEKMILTAILHLKIHKTVKTKIRLLNQMHKHQMQAF